jgi:hypothetical protein
VVGQGGQTRNIMAADAQVPSLAFLVSRTRRCNAPPPQWGSIGIRVGVHVMWAIWVTYGGAGLEGWGVAGTIPVGIIVAVMTELHPIGIRESALARSGGIIEVVVAIVVAICRGSAIATVAFSGGIVKTTVAVVVVPRGIKALGWTGIVDVRRAGGEIVVLGMVICLPPTVRRFCPVCVITTGWYLIRRTRLFIRWGRRSCTPWLRHPIRLGGRSGCVRGQRRMGLRSGGEGAPDGRHLFLEVQDFGFEGDR